MHSSFSADEDDPSLPGKDTCKDPKAQITKMLFTVRVGWSVTSVKVKSPESGYTSWTSGH